MNTLSASSTASKEEPKVAISDEKEAVLSLLGLHDVRASPRANKKPKLDQSSETDSSQQLEKACNDEDKHSQKSGAFQPVAQNRDPQASVFIASRPQAISPVYEVPLAAVPPSLYHGAPRSLIGRKRKNHSTVTGQFEDANGNANGKGIATGASTAQVPSRVALIAAGGGSEIPWNEETHAFPPPPHLIQQTSNEFPSTGSRGSVGSQQESPSHAPTAEELARQLWMRNLTAPYLPGWTTNDARAFAAQQEAQAKEQALRAHYEATIMMQWHKAGRPGGVAPLLPSAARFVPHRNLSTFQALEQARLHSAAAGRVSLPATNEVQASTEARISSSTDAVPQTVCTTEKADSNESSAAKDTESRTPQGSTQEPDSKKTGAKARVSRGPISTKMRYEYSEAPASWSELTGAPRMPHTEPDAKHEHPIEEAGDFDILLGRGGLSNLNGGNLRFRALVRKHRIHYSTAEKGDKGALARYLCNYIRSKTGRFLQKDRDDHKWYEVGDDKAVMKCAQALRESQQA